MRTRIVLASLLTASLLASVAPPAAARDTGQRGAMLALGDSISFGYNPLLPFRDATAFVGWPDVVAPMLHLRDVNASCPGEATGGFLSPTGVDNICRPYKAAYPLHVRYTGTQLAFALSYLRAHRDVRLVTLQLGANDLLALEHRCPPSPQRARCIAAHVPGALTGVRRNLRAILGRLRAVYHGPLLMLTYYALSYDPRIGLTPIALARGAGGLFLAGAVALNAEMVRASRGFHVLVASGFRSYIPDAMVHDGNSCTAGLLIVVPPGSSATREFQDCNGHPSPRGRDLLAGTVLWAIQRAGGVG